MIKSNSLNWRFLIILTSFLLSSCATIINGTTDQIKITVDRPGAKVFINEVPLGISDAKIPLTAEIPKKGKVVVEVHAENCKSEYHSVQRTIDPVTFLGLLIDGGIISILGVDILATNAFVHAEYDQINFYLDCN